MAIPMIHDATETLHIFNVMPWQPNKVVFYHTLLQRQISYGSKCNNLPMAKASEKISGLLLPVDSLFLCLLTDIQSTNIYQVFTLGEILG